MSNSRKLYIFLWLSLILTNAFWAYSYINDSVYCSYQTGFIKSRDVIIDQLFAVIPLITDRQAKKQEVIKAAKLDTLPVYCRNNEICQIGALQFKFDEHDNFVEIVNR